MFSECLIFLSLSSLASACSLYRTLQVPFSRTDFKGNWYHLLVIQNEQKKSSLLKQLSCSGQTFQLANDGFDFESEVDLYFSYFHKTFRVNLTMADTSGFMTSKDIDVEVLCTDYTNWAIAHYCIKKRLALKIIVLMARGRGDHKTLINSSAVKGCLQAVGVAAEHGNIIHQDDCQ